MRIAYLLFVYKNPRLVARVIRTLSCDDATFFVHVDQKSSLADFDCTKGENVHFTSRRLPVYWAEFSGVRATLLLMEEALGAKPLPDYLVLLSGSDYPLNGKEYIHDFFERHRGSEFINMVGMPNEKAGKPLSRVNTYRAQSHEPMKRVVSKALAKVGCATRDYRKYLGGMEPYAGNTWWALSRYAVQYILDFVQKNRSVSAFFEDTFAPEEMFIHTILGNSVFRSSIRRNIMFEDWSGQGGHPEPIGEAHLELFEKGGAVTVNDVYGSGEALFARKFTEDSPLLDRMDRLIARGGAQLSTPAGTFRPRTGNLGLAT
ncbi:beta-1,6-N-acetylglucosaminyltransferase [Geomonas sp. RF6]|uniref:beta-1,6-N-acetylglucosaminyltransferase n=1 Tax=Geomonas sp. RF6 TaxID=2897342 RepID=UPI001E35712B|nr:beta-1,6-N-acetylglucosaminyltransferase [Geomonas sp. RF6]UFS71079.1 beta-1,6-N-acetylglucosaminyltransferase [Geomonas sp. RF6]